MIEQENILQVTVYANQLRPDARGTAPWALMLQKVAHTIEQFEGNGWQVQDVIQDNCTATITFCRFQPVEVGAMRV